MRKALVIAVLLGAPLLAQRLVPGIGVGGVGGGGGTGCTVAGAAGELVANDGSTGCNSISDYVFTTHTLAGTSNAIFDMHLAATSAVKMPGGFATGLVHVTTTTGATIGGLLVNADITNGTIAAAKLIGSDITVVGTIATGVWQGTVIGTTYGGLGAALNAAAAHSTLISNGATPAVYLAKTIPDCTDTGGNHLNFTQSTDAFSCGTSGGSGGGVSSIDTATGAILLGTGLTRSSQTISFDSSVLSGVYAALASANTYSAGARQTTAPSSTTPGFRITAGSFAAFSTGGGTPLLAGDEAMDSSGHRAVFTGTNLDAYVTFAGTGAALTAAPTATHMVKWGSNYQIVSTGAATWATADIANNAVNSAKMAVVNTRRVCDIGIGDTSGSALTNGQLGPQKRGCYIPAASTVVEVDVSADAGTPSVIVGRNVAGTQADILSGALSTASSGGIACSKTTAVTGIDGATTCSATLQNTALAAGSYLELVSGTAGGTAKWMTVHIVYTVD